MPDDIDFDRWMNSGRYMPAFMRDFHAQKNLFKALHEIVERRTEKDDYTLRDVTWLSAHVYTVDVFLWAMAKHGYTLQRSRKRFAFGDIRQTVEAAMERWRSHATAMLRAAMNNPSQ